MPEPEPIHRLTRLFESSGGTWGELVSASGARWSTMELPWLDNRPRVSCIPPGRYQLVPWASKRFPAHFALVGPGVGLVPAPKLARSSILIHAANRPAELRGCIALGRLVGLGSDNGLRLAESRAACRAFFAELRAATVPGVLEIVGGKA